MNSHVCFSLSHRVSGTKTFRIVAVVLILAVPLSVVVRHVWNCDQSADAMTASDKHSSSTARKPIQPGPMEIRELQASVSVNSAAFADNGDPIAEMLRQEDEENLSVVFVGQMFALPAVALAQRHMIDGAVNRHSDTLLHVACQSGNQLAMWLLIEAGASPTVKNRFEETPLDVAIGSDAQTSTDIATIMKQGLIPTPLMVDPAAHQS